MDIADLLADTKMRARIDDTIEDDAILLLLTAAAGDVAYAASYTLPDDAVDLPDDMRFAIVDQAAKMYDQRGPDEGKPGLSLAASRIVARYRGVAIGAAVDVDVA